ncbi:MAG: hydrogenase 4 subunit B [Enterobacteriaceae bacterium]|jgi:hydrogenase-4 component B|nr:hydrogenase 4 subunit B [Enterobacteriaceae bacterium]
MGNPLHLLFLSVMIYLVGAILPPLTSRNEKQIIKLSAICSIAGGTFGLLAAAPILSGAPVIQFAINNSFSFFAHFMVRIDGLAAFMVMMISLLVIATALFSVCSAQEYIGKGARFMGFFMNLFIASMVLLVVIDNAFYFLVLFEMMLLTSYFLVITNQDEKSVSAGSPYFLTAHFGMALIILAFFLLYQESSSMDFDSFRQAKLSAPMASAVFLLGFFGFGVQAGIISLHSWLPRTQSAAPSHVCALMSGVMVKIGIFGMIKISIDFLGAASAWWGILVLILGAISAVLGGIFALAEHDLKRLLAYHTVENVGIILIAIGVSMVGIATQHPTLAVLGMLGALYHLLNHAVYKGLLFLGAGAITYRLHSKDLELMGGLAKLMPYTAVCFFIGTLAITALPPLNGFVSEWFTYQSLFTLSLDGSLIARIVAPLAIIILAITGALAALCFVKVYGVGFAGAARSEKAAQAREVPLPMVLAMVLLALLCLMLGVGAPLVSPLIADIAANLTQQTAMPVASGSMVFTGAGATAQTVLSTPLITVLLIGLLSLPLLIYAIFKNQRLRHRHGGTAWACGYAYDDQMPVSAGAFTQPLRTMFAPIYRLREWQNPILQVLTILFDKPLQWLQQGNFRRYCLYTVIALITLMIVSVIL